MKTKCFAYGALTVVMLLLSLGPSARAKIGVSVSLNSVIGDVHIFKTNQGWTAASSGDSLTLDDRIKTGVNARAELEYSDGTVMRMKSNCELVILENAIKLNYGDTWIQAVKRGNRFKVVTPTAVAGIKGTVFEVDVLRDTGDTRVAVYNGIVEVTGMDSRILLFSARQTMIKKGKPPEKPAYFDKWQEQKSWADKLFKSAQSTPGKTPGRKPKQPETGQARPDRKGDERTPPPGGALQWPPVGKIKPPGAEPPPVQPGTLKPLESKPGLRDKLARDKFDRSPPPEELRERFRDGLGREIRNPAGRPQAPPPGQRHEAATVEDLKHEQQPPWKRAAYQNRVAPPTAKEGFAPGYRDRTTLELSDRKDLPGRETASPLPPRPPGAGGAAPLDPKQLLAKPDQGPSIEIFSRMPREEQNRILELMRDERKRQLDILRQRINDQEAGIPAGLPGPAETLPGADSVSTQNRIQNLNELYNSNRGEAQLPAELPDGVNKPGKPGSGRRPVNTLKPGDIRKIRPPRQAAP